MVGKLPRLVIVGVWTLTESRHLGHIRNARLAANAGAYMQSIHMILKGDAKMVSYATMRAYVLRSIKI